VKTKLYLPITRFSHRLAIALLAVAPLLHGVEDAVLSQNGNSATLQYTVPLFAGSHARLEGALTQKEFSIRLPEHLRWEAGSELVIHLRTSPLLLGDISTLSISLNDRELSSVRLGDKASERGEQSKKTLVIPIDATFFLPGWNKVTLSCLMQTTGVPCRDVDNPAAWMELDPGSALKVAYSKQSLFPEIQRFPEEITESQLMSLPEFRPVPTKKNPEAVVSILLPWDAGESELRTLLICSARLGQLGYISPDSISTGDLNDFESLSGKKSGILIGTKAAFQDLPLPQEFQKNLSQLKDGEGFIGEFITGNTQTSQGRWIIVAGGDPSGLEKAALTMGSASALRGVPSNPWIISTAPKVSPIEEKMTEPSVGAVTIESLAGGAVTLNGLFRSNQSRALTLPPGWETKSGGVLELDLSHAGDLERTSALQSTLNGVVLGSVALTPENANSAIQRIAIPAGILGRDPSGITFSSYMDIGAVDCSHRHDERAWLHISGKSNLSLNVQPVQINDLSRLGELCLRDAFLRDAVIVVPEVPEAGRNDLLKTIGVFLGGKIPSMPVLWPQVATYAPGVPPSPERIGKRSGLILGSAFQWPDALGKKMHLVIEGMEGKSGMISLRGEPISSQDFDPSLSLAQLVPSPWSKGGVFATIGGLNGYGVEGTTALLTDPEVTDRLSGSVVAVDDQKRVVTYDVRFIQEVSLSQQLHEGFAGGASRSELENKKQDKIEAGLFSHFINKWIIGGTLAILAILFLMQRHAARRRKKEADGREL
jgi:hypothetical protein